MRMMLRAAALAAVSGITAFAVADTMFTATLQPLNDSNVTGNAILTLSDDLSTLTVQINAENLEPDMPHAQHIHGLFDGNGDPADSTTPTLADDTDGDGFIEVGEGAAAYGPVILPLTSPGGSGDFPTAPMGIINFTETYDLSDMGIFANDYEAADLFPLFFREIVLHGKSVADGQGAGTDGEVDGTGGYKAALPVAAGVIVPEPTSLGAIIVLASLGLRRRR